MEQQAEHFHPKAVILDMDGLMLDTERPVLELWTIAGRNFGQEIPAEMTMRLIGTNDAGTRALFFNEYGNNFPYEKIRQETERLMAEKLEREGIALRPGLITLLDYLAGRNIPFAVATSTDRKTALWKLEKAGIRERFSLMVCGDEIKNGKPAPDIFLAAAGRLGVSPAGCAGFEDSAPGLRGLYAAEIRSVFIKDLVEPPPEVLATVWRQYRDLEEALAIFGTV
ncbi:haloacid dehalogenase [Spirochaetia bacterium]|nr:haloacid dehalogenase [Spirochaetia bacterium]